MIKRKNRSPLVGDIEKSHLTVTDSIGDELGAQPLTIRLGALWSDFVRVANESRNPESPKESTSAVPLLDDMKGILQWD